MLTQISKNLFQKQSYFNLSVCRILFYLYICTYHLITLRYWVGFSDFPDLFRFPTGIFKFLSSFPIDRPTYTLILYGSMIFSFFSAIGFLGRLSLIISFVGFAFLNSLPQMHHTLIALNTPNFFVLLIFCFSQAHRNLSVDNFIFRNTSQSITGDYSWPIQLIKFTHILFIFLAGLYKLRDAGFSWFTTKQLQNEVLCAHFYRGDSAPLYIVDANLNLYFGQFSWLMITSSFLVFFAELLSPLVFANWRFKWVLLSILFAMQFLSIPLLFINPYVSLGLYLFWVNWDDVYLFTKKVFKV